MNHAGNELMIEALAEDDTVERQPKPPRETYHAPMFRFEARAKGKPSVNACPVGDQQVQSLTRIFSADGYACNARRLQ